MMQDVAATNIRNADARPASRSVARAARREGWILEGSDQRVGIGIPDSRAESPSTRHPAAVPTHRESNLDRIVEAVAEEGTEVTSHRPLGALVPTARGRVIYGDSGLVKWGQLWHPGADSATRIAFSAPVTFEGRPLSAGTYSIWAIPRESAAWTVILNSRAHVFHSPYIGAATEVLRVDVMPVRGPHMESLAYYFPAVARDSTVLRLHWGETMIPLRVRVGTEPPR